MKEMLTHKEQIQELEQKIWYRFVKIIAIIWLALSFVVPFTRATSIEAGFVDGGINIIVWFIVIQLLKHAILYTVFGKTKKQELGADMKERIFKKVQQQKRIFISVLGILFLFVIISMVLLYAAPSLSS